MTFCHLRELGVFLKSLYTRAVHGHLHSLTVLSLKTGKAGLTDKSELRYTGIEPARL